MEQIWTAQIFSAPRWQKITYRIASLLVLALGVNIFMLKDIGWLIFLIPLLFLISISMFLYTRQKLIISNDEIRFVGGFKSYLIPWSTITKVDMLRLGKFKTPTATIYYSGGKLRLNRGFYLEPQFKKILSLLEMKIDSELYTKEYWEIRSQIQ